MDSHSELVLQNGFLPNGLLPKGASSVTRPLDPVRWAIAEERTAELISRIQPNWTAEKHRNAVASYVQRLIGKCVPCEVFTFGSVPLRTYLPDGDIDLTAFSEDHNVKDYWAKSVLEILRSEEKNECAEFQVKEVQYIQAEVKIIKCLVDNIVVDISFNQLGGLCTLCFLEEVDNLISQNHLFKRSIILIKAWCYYESRILGAHHGLISTYALETLVLYIFHVFNNSFAGPLEVLYRFVEFFSKFDWANFCVSLWGPVPICSLPIMAADPPRKDGEELLLNKMFLNACSTAYSVFPPRRHDNQEQPFVSKHFNVVDPLRRNNNLGRSVSKGNFYRIRSAFSFGAQQLAKILECEQENIVDEVNQFFVNTWDRHGKGCRPDAPMPKSLHIRQVDSEHDGNCRNNELAETATQNFTSQCPQIDESHNSIELLMQRSSFPVNPMASAINVNKDLHTPLRKDCDEESKTKMDSGWDQYYTQKMNPTRKQLSEKERIFRANILQNRRHATPQFARTSSSPELTSMSSEAVSLRRHNAPKARVKEVTSSRSEYNRRTRDSDTMESHVINCFTDVPFTNENSSSGGNASKPVTSSTKSVVHSGDLPSQRHQLGQDFMNMHMPVNLASYPFVSISPSIPGYRPKNFSGAPVAPFQQSNPVGAIPDSETTRAINREPASVEVERMNDGHGLWTDCNADDSMKDVDHESENFSAASSRLSPASSANSYGTKGSSESSWDGKPSKINDAVRYSLTKTSSSSKKPTATVNGRQLDIGPVDCIYDDVNDKPAVPSVTSLRGEANMLPGFGQAHMRYPNSMLPFAPLLVPPGSQQGVNHAVLPIAFYPAGPPVPFVTVVPVGNINAETVASGVPASHDDAEMEKSTFPVGQSSPSSHSAKELEKLNYSNSFGSTKRNAVRGQSNECELDIFNSDFANHWKNLQYGRLCQNSQLQHPAAPSVFVPHPHLQGNTPYPRSPNVVAHPVPLSVQQPVPSESAVVSRQYGELPKHRNGTGTYFPNPEVLRDRQFVTSKQHQVDSKHGRNEYHGEREENWNFSSKPRFAGRVHPRYRNDKRNSKIDRSVASSSQTYRPCDTFRKNSHQLYNFPKDPSTPKSTWNEHYDADHLVYQTCLEYPDEFGSVGPESCLGADKVQVFRGYPEGSDLEHQNFHGDTESPPDYACPPRFLRSDRV